MASERVQRQIDRLLDEAEEAVVRHEWDVVRARGVFLGTRSGQCSSPPT